MLLSIVGISGVNLVCPAYIYAYVIGVGGGRRVVRGKDTATGMERGRSEQHIYLWRGWIKSMHSNGFGASSYTCWHDAVLPSRYHVYYETLGRQHGRRIYGVGQIERDVLMVEDR